MTDKNGQPCDVIAINGEKTILLDVKHCDRNRFYMTRVEPNQKTCFDDEKGGFKEYNAYVGHDEEYELSQEEYELLKEVLENE